MSKLSKRKGAQWEREVAALFNAAMPGADAKRGLVQSRSGSEGADVDVPWFWVEAKHRRALTAQAALRQALEASKGTGKLPLAVLKPHRQTPFVALFLEDFLQVVQILWATRDAPEGAGEGPSLYRPIETTRGPGDVGRDLQDPSLAKGSDA